MVQQAKASRGRVALASGVLVALMATATLAATVIGNDFGFNERNVTVTTSGEDLQAVLVTPQQVAPVGVVLMLHGDGATSATQDGLYAPIFETFTTSGWAVLSWDKPGVNESPGNWLHQSMSDRADEAVEAAAWATDHLGLDDSNVGLWAASQGGWVAPLVVNKIPDVAFVVAASPAINWQQQNTYHTEQLIQDTDPETQNTTRDREETIQELLDANASYEEYQESLGDDATMTADRWLFVTLNHRSDASATLPAMRNTPTLLQLGGQDRNVDIAATEAGYTAAIEPDALTVKTYPKAAHALTKPRYDNNFFALPVALVWPRALFADGVLADTKQFVTDNTPAS